jgi:hypothetical protein
MHKLIKFIIFLVYSSSSVIFFAELNGAFARRNVTTLATISMPVLGLIMGFTSLLFNRSKSLPTGHESIRTLYAAERSMQACVLYVFGLASGLVLYKLVSILNIRSYVANTICFLPSTFLLLMSLCSFYLALLTISSRLLRYLSIIQTLRRIRCRSGRTTVTQ